MNKFTSERELLGQQLVEAETKLATMQKELNGLDVLDPAYHDTRWLVDAQRRTCMQVRDSITREERNRWNAIGRKLRELLHRDHPQLCVTLVAEAERIVDGEA